MRDLDEVLLKAAAQGDLAAAQVALSRGASNDATNDVGSTALEIAASLGHLAIVRLLIGSGADVNRRGTCFDTTPLFDAIGWPEVMEVLLDAGADVNRTASQGV